MPLVPPRSVRTRGNSARIHGDAVKTGAKTTAKRPETRPPTLNIKANND